MHLRSLLLSAAVVAAPVAAQERFSISLPAQSLEASLRDISRATGLQLLFTDREVLTVSRAPLSGRLTPEEMIGELLAGTGYAFRITPERVIHVFKADPPRSLLRPARFQFGPTPEPSVRPAASAEAPSEAEEIVVVGSTLGTQLARVEQGATPVQLITADEIARGGDQTVAGILQSQPAFSGTNGNSEGAGTGRTTLNLRGIGDQYTLTLLNGRRFSVNGAANVALVPAAAIERVEVLTSGASALYGSDAVAGVVNLALRRDADGSGVSVRYGAGRDSLSEIEVGAFTGNKTDEGGFFLAVSHLDRDPLFGRTYRYGSNDQRALGGFDVRSGFTNPGRVFLPDGRQVTIDTERFGVGQSSLNPADYRAFNFDRDAHDRFTVGLYSVAPSERSSVAFAARRALGPDTELTVDLLGSRIVEKTIVGASTYRVDVPQANPFNPFGSDVAVNIRFLDRDPSGGPFGAGNGFETRTNVLAGSGAATLTHRFTDALRLETTANYFIEHTDIEQPQLVERLFLDEINSLSASAYNPFCNRCNGPEQYAAFLTTPKNEQTSKLFTFDTRLAAELGELAGGPVRLSVGGIYRREDFNIDADALYATGSFIDGPTLADQDLTREVGGAFAEVRLPVLQRLEVAGAARYEHFSDFGGTFNPSFSARWEVLPDTLVLRGSYDASFRAPFLQDLTAGVTQGEVNLFDPQLNAQVDAIVNFGGNPDLDAEDARTFSGGVIVTPPALRGLSVKVDYFNLRQTNLIISPDPQAIFLGDVPGMVVRCDGCGQGGENIIIDALLTNIGARTVEGIDFATTYRTTVGATRLTFDLAGTRLLGFRANNNDGAGSVDEAGTFSFVYGALPKWRVNAMLVGESGPVTLSARTRYVGSYSESAIGDSPALRVPSRTYVDLAGSIDFAKLGGPGLELSVGVDNIAGTAPPFVRNTAFAFGSLRVGPYDEKGRFVYARLAARF